MPVVKKWPIGFVKSSLKKILYVANLGWLHKSRHKNCNNMVMEGRATLDNFKKVLKFYYI